MKFSTEPYPDFFIPIRLCYFQLSQIHSLAAQQLAEFSNAFFQNVLQRRSATFAPVSRSWPRWFHAMRASRQTELQREFPLHVVCSWLGNSLRISQQSYLLVTEDDLVQVPGEAKLMME